MAMVHCIDDCPPLPEVEGVEIRHVPEYMGYAVGNDGSVWSCLGTNQNRPIQREWRPLNLSVGTHGYRKVTLSLNGKRTTVTVPRLMATVFLGSAKPKEEVCHYDGNRTNDVIPNLRWDTHKRNAMDMRRHGRMRFVGSTNPKSRLSWDNVLMIRTLQRYCAQVEIARLFGVSQVNISGILLRKKWNYDSDPNA